MSLRIHTFGAFSVFQDNAPIPESAWKIQKNKALFKILLTHRQRALTKDELIEWLWRDLDPDMAGLSLRVAISTLRRVLEPNLPRGSQSHYILTTESGYAWNGKSDYWLDADEFESLYSTFQTDAESARKIEYAERARELYAGEYLEEDRYADWAIAERERLHELYFNLLTQLAETYARQGQYRRAIVLCRNVLSADRCRESVWCQLMLYHYHSGDQALALRAFEECQRSLADELGVEPLPETLALVNQIRHRTTITESIYPLPSEIERVRQLPLSLGHTPFVGRQVEYHTLVKQLDHATAGRGSVLLVEGEAGVGKTRMAEEILGFARQQQFRVLECTGKENAIGLPYQPIIDALQSSFEMLGIPFANLPPSSLASIAKLIPQVIQLNPDLPKNISLSPEQEKNRLFEALTQLLTKSSSNAQPVLLFVDDVHWADASTLEFLGYLAARIAQEPVVVLGTLRSEEVAATRSADLGGFLLALKRRGILYRQTLGPLSREAVSLLLGEMAVTAEIESNLAQKLYQESEGNALFLISILQSMFEEGLLVVNANGTWSVDKSREKVGELPQTIHQVVTWRIQRLGDEERQTLETASVLGREFQWDALSRMRTWRRDLLLDRLDFLQSALLIHPSGRERYSFNHDKIHQVAYDNISGEQRGWLHGRAGEALETLNASRLDEIAGTLAYHYERAGWFDKSFQHRLRAGRYALGLYANAEAISHYRDALALVGRDGFQPAVEALREAHETLGDSYQAVGEYAFAAEQFNSALKLDTGPVNRIRTLYKLAHNFDRQGQRGDATELFARAITEIEHLASDQRDELLTERLYARWSIFNSPNHGYAGSEHFARRAIDIINPFLSDLKSRMDPLPPIETEVVKNVLNNAGEAFRFSERWMDAAELFQQSLIIAERQNDPVGHAFASHNLGDVTMAQGNFAAARELYRRAIQDFSRAGRLWEEMASSTHLGITYACEGDWHKAAEALERARQIGESIKPTVWLADVYLWLALIETRTTRDLERVHKYRERATSVAQSIGQPVQEELWLLSASAENALVGRTQEALEDWQNSEALIHQNQEWAMYRRWILPQFAI